MTRTAFVAASFAAVVPMTAQAEGFYISAGAGANFLDSALNQNGPNFQINSDYDTGWLIRGAAGYGFANGLRIEAEAGYRQNDWTRLRIKTDGGLGAFLGLPPLNGVTLNTSGDEGALSFMANGWYDFKNETPFTPYLGGGVGFSRLTVNGLGVPGLNLVTDSDVVFAYQLGGGVAYAITPRLSLTLDYRYFSTTDPTFRDFTGVPFRSEYESHSVSMGLMLGF
jgi:outer membrane immunogenic protein